MKKINQWKCLMSSISGGSSSSYGNDADELKKYLDSFESDEPETERLVLFRGKDGQVHVIGKKINTFEGLWAKLGLSKKLLSDFGLVDANIRHVLQHLNEKKISDPRLRNLIARYNSKRKYGKIREKDFPNLFPELFPS